MISIVLPHVSFGPEAEEMLKNCTDSLSGYDELILVVNDGIGYGASFNRGFKLAKGDYIMAVSNDTVFHGKLKDLCDPTAVTFTKAQFGCFFCLPRWVYEKVGGFDEEFGLAYYEDEDYLLRLKDAGIPVKRLNIEVDHIGGATVKALGKEQEASDFGKQIFIKKWGERRASIPELL